jgi:hypothetical protein
MLAIALACCLWVGSANAQTPADLARLDQQISLDREARPELYAAVEALRRQAPRMDRLKRGRLAVMGPGFQSLGPDATFALADALLDDRGFDTQQPPSVRRAWRVGMLNALRHWRDPVVRPALEALLTRPEKDLAVIRATAEALAMLMSDDAAQFLIGEVSGDDPRSLAVASALGLCRRSTVAHFLAGKLYSAASDEARDVYIEALGDVANAWAWDTAPVAASGEAEAVRGTARDALLDFYMSHDGKPANEAMKGILLANLPDTEGILRTMRVIVNTDAERRKIDFLSERVRNNPLNRR